MVEHNPEGLHFITYLALIILFAVLFFYLRQRREYHRRIQEEYYFASQHIPPTVKSVGFSPQLIPESDQNLPTFSAQEAGQRKMPRQIDHSEINRRNLSTISDFASNISNYEPLSRNKDQLNNTADKIFGDTKRNQSYEPSRLIASPAIASPKSWKPEQTIESSFRSTAEFLIPQTGDQQGLQRIVQTIQIVKEEPLIAPDNQNMHGEMETENKVLKDPKRKDSNQLDRSGLSLDSPLRMLGSPVTATNSKKKLNPQDDDQVGSKVDSSSKTQETKLKNPVLPSQRSMQNKLLEKNQRKARRNDYFIDNESDDEMIAEDTKDESARNKRPAKNSRDIDIVEKDISSRKYLKNNESESRIRANGEKNATLDDSEAERLDKSLTNSSKMSSKRRSVADLSYISEHGVSNSMKRYIEKKNGLNESHKTSNFTPSPRPKSMAMAIEEKPKDPFFAKSQEKSQKETPKSLFSTQNLLGASPTQNKSNNFLFTTQPKPTGITETASSQKAVFANKESGKISEEEKPTQGKSIFGKKNEEEEKGPAKPAQFSSLFNQQKPAETQPLIKPTSMFSQPKPEGDSSGSIFKQKESPPAEKVESTKQAESPKQSPPQTQSIEQEKVGIFKPETQGSIFANKGEKNNIFGSKQENFLQQEEKTEEKTKEAQSSIFSATFGNKKLDTDPKEQEQKTETKPLLQPSGGLFGNLTSGSAFNPLKASKISSEAENAPPSLLKVNSSPPGKSTMTNIPLFGSSFNKPTEEAGFGLNRSSSSAAPNVDDSSEKEKKEGSQGGLFNNLISQKRDLNSLFGGPKTEEKKEPESSTSLGLFSTPSTLFKSASTEQKTLDFSNKPDPLGNYAKMPEGVGKPGGLFGQKTEQPLVGFTSPPTGNLFSQRDSPKRGDNPLASFAKNPVESVESPKKADNPLAGFSQNPTGNLFGKRGESPKKADKPVIGSVQNPTGNIFGQNADSSKKPEGIFGNLLKSTGEGSKSSLFGNSGAFGSNSQANAPSGNTAASTTGFGSLFKNDGKIQGGLFSNLGGNNTKPNDEQK